MRRSGIYKYNNGYFALEDRICMSDVVYVAGHHFVQQLLYSPVLRHS